MELVVHDHQSTVGQWSDGSGVAPRRFIGRRFDHDVFNIRLGRLNKRDNPSQAEAGKKESMLHERRYSAGDAI